MALAEKIHAGLKQEAQRKKEHKSESKLHEMRITRMDDGSYHIAHHHKVKHEHDREPHLEYEARKEYTAKNHHELARHVKEHFNPEAGTSKGGLKDTAENQNGGGKETTRSYQKYARANGGLD